MSKDEVTQEVTTTANHDPSTATPSQRVQEEQAAGRAAVRDAGRTPAAGGINPADRDPAHAAEVAIAMNNAAYEAAHAEPTSAVPEGEKDPSEVPSRGYPYAPLPGEENTQGTAARKTSDPRLTDPDTDTGQRAEAVKQTREMEEAQAKEQTEHADKRAQHERNERNKKK
jgi:hypothetical protein